jgi:hypothetical protein
LLALGLPDALPDVAWRALPDGEAPDVEEGELER